MDNIIMPQMTIQQACELAFQHHRAGRLEEAERLYRQILQQHPEHAAVMQMLGQVSSQLGRHDAAVDLFRRAISLRSNHAGAYSDLGHALMPTGRFAEAIAACRRAIAIEPGFAEAHNNLGNALKENGQFDEAIAACRDAIALKPQLAEAHNNLGNALKEKGRTDESVAACRQAIALRPGMPEAHNNLANALRDKGALDDAIAEYRRAIELRPDWQRASSNLLLTLNYHPDFTAKMIAAEHARWNQQHAEPLRRFVEPHLNDKSPDRRMRVGYVSGDFYNHAVAHFIFPLLQHHDRKQVEIFCYSQVQRPDEITRRFKQFAAQWRSIIGLSDEQTARQIRDDRIDILVDLSLHTSDNRLLVFARKPAPVQVTFAGYPGTTGLTAIDYRLSDPYLDPPGMDESVYSEKTIRLPDSFWCYDPMYNREIAVNSLPALESGAITFGCLNSFLKINERVLALWLQVLRNVHGSRLLLMAAPGDHRQRTKEFLSQHQVDPERVEFFPRQPRRAYMELYHRIDIGLDSFPYNGHTTSLDAWWMGVPVITLVGQTSVSRAGFCQMSNLGLPELAAHSPEQFVQIAVALARDLPRLQLLRSTLRSKLQSSPLMDVPRFVGNIELAYRRMWQQWCISPPLRL